MGLTNRKNKNFLLSLIFVSSCAFSNSETITSPSSSSLLSTLRQGHFSFEVGSYQATQGKEQHINIQDLIGDTFTVNDHHNTSSLLGLGYFIDGKNRGPLSMQYGVNAFYLTPTSVSGNVIQENLFTNLSYHYSLANYPIYVMAKSNIHLKPTIELILDSG